MNQSNMIVILHTISEILASNLRNLKFFKIRLLTNKIDFYISFLIKLYFQHLAELIYEKF